MILLYVGWSSTSATPLKVIEKRVHSRAWHARRDALIAAHVVKAKWKVSAKIFARTALMRWRKVVGLL